MTEVGAYFYLDCLKQLARYEKISLSSLFIYMDAQLLPINLNLDMDGRYLKRIQNIQLKNVLLDYFTDAVTFDGKECGSLFASSIQ